MSQADDRKEVFAWFGAAAYHAQCVEEELWIARLFLARTQEGTHGEQDWSRVESEPLTMGGLLKLVKEGIVTTEAELASLRACVKKRNWLFHSFWGERAHLLFSVDGCREAVRELKDLCDLFESSDEVARGLSARIRARLGVSEGLVHELQADYLKRLCSGEPSAAILESLEHRLKQEARRPKPP